MGRPVEGRRLTTALVAAEAGCSVQQVRDLEALGVIPAATRSANGYRQFSEVHVRSLHAYGRLAHAVGPVEARRVMRELRRQPADEAVALLGRLHVGLHREREQALAARRALESIRDEATTDAAAVEADSMTITQLSQALGVRSSTLRFWERAGLVAPQRVATRAGTARLYPVTAIREARITAALRAGGYRIPEVRAAIGAIRDLGEVDRTVAALDARLQAIAERSLSLLRAGTLLADLIGTTVPVTCREAAGTPG